ncbi:MAG: hypothetical protein ABFQ62_00995 [Patescibacteria group bacterium]
MIKRKDKILIKKTLTIATDAFVDELDKDYPGIKIAWNLSKSLFGAAIKLREEKALEWVEMVKDNPRHFTENVLSDEKFQDGFAIAFERYLVERSSKKREIFRNIFLGFSEAADKESFPLEKCTHTLSQLSQVDILTLGDVDISKIDDRNYQVYGANANRRDNIINLIGLGILIDTTGNRMGFSLKNSPFVRVSPFGLEFIGYIKDK